MTVDIEKGKVGMLFEGFLKEWDSLNKRPSGLWDASWNS